MKLQQLKNECGCFRYRGRKNPDIRMVSTDSRKTKSGDIFIAIEGFKDNGVLYIKDAVKKGARAVVVEEKNLNRATKAVQVPVCSTNSIRRCALLLARILFGYPSKAFQLVGVTGTNGKTTVTYLIEAIFKSCGFAPGVIGTISYRWGERDIKAHNTTPDPVEIHEMLTEMRRAAVSHVVMEVSSHALSMERVHPTDFDYAIFTNLSQDHLDFHRSMNDYFDAKAKLFRGLEGDKHAIINRDDAYGKKLILKTNARVVTYGMNKGANYRGHSPVLSINGTEFSINGRKFHTNLVGVHNVYNILAAVALARCMGIDEDVVVKALSSVGNVPGRFERVKTGKDFHVFVDYAHTPDALSHLLEAANSLKEGRIITVFGCGGDRDRGKRPKMGRVVEENSDLAIVTSDNPRTEDPLVIIEDIKKGLRANNHVVIPDRREAIYRSIEIARRDDIVLIAGKGHEDYQILKEKTIHFDDREIAAGAVRDLDK
jgi:UDP-N-acetylmuramyl-tripeptide synthetase